VTMLRIGVCIIILVAARYFLVALRQEGKLTLKARVQVFIAGLFLIAVGCAAVNFNQGDILSALTLSDYWMGTAAICLGYSLWIVLALDILSVVQQMMRGQWRK
jgi:hypothetical protein